ncbi:uncharacterized protein [Nicotiana sylvestris]|uniref:uncharacterized protein n=1 Tax=Nicotiana sylvestris TaxID=4096 RepID=UPI00388C3FE8
MKAIQELPLPKSKKDVLYITQKTIKGQALADHLIENSVDRDYEPITTYFPDEKNDFDDVLATTSSMIQHQNKNYIDPIEVEITDQYDYYFYIDEELDGKLWYHDVNGFLEIREYLENANNSQKKACKRLENHFFLNREVLL